MNSASILRLDHAEVSESVRRLVDVRIALLREELRLYFGVIVGGAASGLFLILPLLHWRGNPVILERTADLKRAIASHRDSKADT